MLLRCSRKSGAAPSVLQIASTAVVERAAEAIEDDRDNLQNGDASLLIVEDDPHYARILCDLARDKGFKVLVASRGSEALALAREYQTHRRFARCLPARHARLDGAEPSEAGAGTRHIPVQMLTLDEDRNHGLSRGAFSFVTKPTTAEGLEAALMRIKEFSSAPRRRLLSRRR